MKRIGISLVLVLSFVIVSQAEVIRLKDGSVINGQVVEQKDSYIVIESSLGRIKIQKYQLQSIDYGRGNTTPQSQLQPPQSAPNTVQGRSQTIYRLEKMIEQGKIIRRYHQKQLQRLSSQLPADYNRLLYKRFEKKNAMLFSVLNSVPTLGSLLQGDYWGVALMSMGYLAGYYLIELSWYSSYGYSDSYGSYYYSSSNYDLEMIGVVVLASSYIYGFIRPFTYKNRYNHRLQKALMSTTTASRGKSHQIYTYNDNVSMPLYSMSF